MKDALKARGMTVKQLSQVTGISKHTLDAYMAGYRKFSLAAMGTVQKIADALGVDPRELNDPPEQ